MDVDRLIQLGSAIAAALVLIWIGARMSQNAGHLPEPEGEEVGGEEEAAQEVGGEEEAAGLDDLALLPEGEHRDLVVATCTTCHGAGLVASQRMTRNAWDQTITWMQKEQALWDLHGEQRGQLLDYLEAWFGPQAASDADRSSPWAHPLYEPNPLW